MFLFSFPLFGEKGEYKQEFRRTKKNTQPQAEKTRAGNFGGGRGHMCVVAIWPRGREAALLMGTSYIRALYNMRVVVSLRMTIV